MLCFTLYVMAISKYKPPPGGGYIWRGDLTECFLRYEFGGLIFGGASTWRGLFSEFYGISCDISEVDSYVVRSNVTSNFWLGRKDCIASLFEEG